jgi:ATP-dependent Lhr-like helicase
LFLRQDAPWLLEAAAARASASGQSPDREQGLSGAARQVLESLSRRGASFLADVVADTRQLTSIVEDALWELAAAGLVTADGFENLRALIDPKRRLATARHSSRRPRFVPGRWRCFAPLGV